MFGSCHADGKANRRLLRTTVHSAVCECCDEDAAWHDREFLSLDMWILHLRGVLPDNHTIPPETPDYNIFAMYTAAGICTVEIFDRAAGIHNAIRALRKPGGTVGPIIMPH